MGTECEIFVSLANAYRRVTSGGEEGPSVDISQYLLYLLLALHNGLMNKVAMVGMKG